MRRTMLPLFLAALALALFVAAPVEAQKDDKGDTHEGTVVKATATKLTMKTKDGKEHSHTLSSDTVVLRGGKKIKAEDLKAGEKIRVTTKKGDKDAVTRIEVLDTK